MQHRAERIRVETAAHRITGTLLLPPEGYRSRLTDFLNAHGSDFIALTDAEVAPLAGGPVEAHAFLALSVGHVLLAVVLEEGP